MWHINYIFPEETWFSHKEISYSDFLIFRERGSRIEIFYEKIQSLRDIPIFWFFWFLPAQFYPGAFTVILVDI